MQELQTVRNFGYKVNGYYQFDSKVSPLSVALKLEKGFLPENVPDLIQGIKNELSKLKIVDNDCSKEITDFFLLVRAISKHLYMFQTNRRVPDDRLCENLEIIFDTFEFDYNGNNRYINFYQDYSSKYDTDQIANFLQRTRSSIFKILVCNLDITTFDKLYQLTKGFVRIIDSNEIEQDLTERLSSIGGKKLSILLNLEETPKIEEFISFLKTNNGSYILPKISSENLKFIFDFFKFKNLEQVSVFLDKFVSKSLKGFSDLSLKKIRTDLNLIGIEKSKQEYQAIRLLSLGMTSKDFDFINNNIDFGVTNEYEARFYRDLLLNGQDFLRFSEFLKSSDGKSFLSVANENIQFLVSSKQYKNFIEIINFYKKLNKDSQTNLQFVSIPILKLFLEKINYQKEHIDTVLELIPYFNRDCQELLIDIIGSLEKTKHSLAELFIEIFNKPEYLEQNLFTLKGLLQKDKFEDQTNITSFKSLLVRFQGVSSVRLAELVIDSKSDEEKEDIIKNYQQLINNVLSSEQVDCSDLFLTSEIIYMAYRPARSSVVEICMDIKSGRIKDLSNHLTRIKVDSLGYKMKYKKVTRLQTSEYDIESLIEIQNTLSLEKMVSNNIVQILQKCFSKQKVDQTNPKIVLSRILKLLNDPRIISYESIYKGVSLFDEKQIQKLFEIFSIIPKETEFVELLKEEISHNLLFLDEIIESYERYQWKNNKHRFTDEEKRHKQKLDLLIKILEKENNQIVNNLNCTELIESISSTLLSDSDKARFRISPSHDVLKEIKEIKRRVYLDIKTQDLKDKIINEVIKIVQNTAKEISSILNRELNRNKFVTTQETDDVTAFISKNIGSFYAKACVEICTASNTGIWEEKRHFHLNVVQNDKVIMNVMLYFEDDPILNRYLIVRGINPRTDILNVYDLKTIAFELTRILTQIAKDNNLSAVFVPQQTSWHELSNRDSMANEILQICKKADPSRVFSFTSNFSFTTEDERQEIQFLLLSSVK